MKTIHKRRLSIIAVFAFFSLCLLIQSASLVEAAPENPVPISVGVWLVNLERVDISTSTCRCDFYLWFKYNPSQINMSEVQQFEFANGAPTLYIVEANETQGYLKYRVRGDFFNRLDFSKFPFDTHELEVQIEHRNLKATSLVFENDPSSQMDPEAYVPGYDLRFQTSVTEHSYGQGVVSRFVFSVGLERPKISSLIKIVLPVCIFTAISLLSYLISPLGISSIIIRISLVVYVLFAAVTFHLAVISTIPTVAYLTSLDRIMISIYGLFLYNLASSIVIMRYVDLKKTEKAISAMRYTLRMLPVIIIILLLINILL